VEVVGVGDGVHGERGGGLAEDVVAGAAPGAGCDLLADPADQVWSVEQGPGDATGAGLAQAADVRDAGGAPGAARALAVGVRVGVPVAGAGWQVLPVGEAAPDAGFDGLGVHDPSGVWA